ncbi:hypothetical protein SARC_03583 [Sphaeroforma arctica JP610]|uniref:Uncharacterized protein n=1 Tax=Sphaeroforma arctica JP610 TaxID=667725 RepID=A0A0L0G7J6_9EUKA|nr:hypothetical protein SARC_03583 [Sphaeroforma arctica JP610]KNC84193.1 hypothetical protein SARC_03583 [Sphaeroforma arctica JP610]|eukprot:XP_014158095.1 hypothetical protein SARC_03583 [Sphaeroforma arctica JP610]
MSQAELPAVNKKSLLELKTQMQTERTQSLQPAHTSTKAHDIIPLEGLRISNSAGSVGVVVEEENKHTGTGIDNRGVAAEPSHVFVTPSLDSLPEHAQLTGVSGGINSASGCTTSDMEGSHISRERRAHENTQTFNDREKHIYREAISATHTHRPVSSTAPMRRGNSHDTFSQPKQISKISTRNQVYSSDCLGDHVPVGKSSNAGKRAQSERSVQFKGMKGPMRHKQQHIPHAEHASRSPHTKSGNRYSHTSNRPKTNASTSQNSLRRMQSMEDRTPRHPNPSAHQQQYKLHRQSSPTSEACSSSHSISNTQYERSTSHPPQHHRNSDHNWHRSNDDMRRSRHSDDQFSQRGGTRQSHTRPHTQHTHMQVRASQSAHTHQYYDGPSRAGYWGDKASYSHDQLHSGRPQQSPVVVQQPKHRSPGVPGSGRSSRGARPHSSPTGHSGHAGSKFTQQQPMQENQLQSHSRNHLVPHATSHGALRSDSDVLSPSFHRHPLGYDDSEYVDEEGYTHTQSMPQLYHDGRQNVRTSVNGSSGVVDVSKQKSVNNSPGSPMFQRDGYNNGTIGSDYCSAVINIDYSGEEDLSYEEDSYVSDDQYYLTEREYHESLMGSLRDHMPQPRAYDEYLHNSRTVHVDVGTAGLGISIKGGLEYGLPIRKFETC